MLYRSSLFLLFVLFLVFFTVVNGSANAEETSSARTIADIIRDNESSSFPEKDTPPPKKDKSESSFSFSKDMGEIREILVDSVGNKPLLRGMMLPLFQPIFIAIMLCFGLWSSQISDRVPIIWSIPAALFLSIVAAAFITAFHTEWKPDLTFGDFKYLPDLSNIQITTILCAIAIGGMVAFNKSISPLGDIGFAVAVGFISGFSQASIGADGRLDTLIFWIGFGMTAVLLNIIGIGFETFLKSMKLSKMVQLFGVISICLGFYLAVKVF